MPIILRRFFFYLVYNRETASYKLHYIDVNGSTKSNGFTANDGTELTNHGISNVSGYVEESSDPTKLNLWNFTDDGYVLVDASGNVKGADGNVDISKLGKQEFIEGMGDNNDHDQYVYLKHAVEEITPETSDSDIPKDPSNPTNSSVDKNTLSKTFTHTIYYKANTTDGATLKDATTQKVTFEGSIYIDKVTPKTTTPITIKVNGEDIQVATTNPGQIIWDKSSQTMEAVDQPTITLNSGDRYTTSDSMIGTWKLVSGKADAIDLTPSSSNPKDVQLVYEKEVQPGGDTGDEPGDQPSPIRLSKLNKPSKVRSHLSQLRKPLAGLLTMLYVQRACTEITLHLVKTCTETMFLHQKATMLRCLSQK